jgi:hypothetical protein
MSTRSTIAAIVAIVASLGCSSVDDVSVDDAAVDDAADDDVPVDEELPDRLGACIGRPHAYVLAPATSTATQRLAAAGFDVVPLPLDRSPFGLQGTIVLGTDAATLPEYAAYMQAYADDLFSFVDAANILVQLPQPADAEPEPPFLPTTHVAHRSSGSVDDLHVLAPDHPLLDDIEVDGGLLAWKDAAGRDSFDEQDGFEIVVAGADNGSKAGLLEGAYGQGRIVLSALPVDAPLIDDPDAAAFADAFFANLAAHTRTICNREGESITPTPPPEPRPFTPGSSVIVALPDTQVYTLRNPGIFDSQTAWIRAHAERLDIRYVFHLGDIVNNNTDREWKNARSSMSLLDGIVSYGMAAGNHDYGPSGDASTRDTGLNTFFSYEEQTKMPGFGGAFEPGKLDNTYHLFELGEHAFIAMVLEWGPRDEVVAWADDVMTAHPDHLGILITHAYLNNNDRRYDHTDLEHPQDFNPHEYDTPGMMNDGEQLWQKLVRRHRFVMTLNGHVLGDGSGYLASTTDLGNVCHQMLSNYQMRDLGGEGYLRILELLPDGRSLIVRSYSPLWDQYMVGSDQYLELELDVD